MSPNRRSLPETASIAERGEDGRLFAPSAARNTADICNVLRGIAPETGRALELASGTGQHIVAYASACPQMIWLPTEVDPDRLASIFAYVRDAQLNNLAPPMNLDATAPGWGAPAAPVELIVLSNLLHLISEEEARTLILEAANALAKGGQFLIYGPFMRGGELTSDGDERFHTSLIEKDPEIGYKDDFDVIDWAMEAGLEMASVLEMPANNLSIVLRKPE